jgi:hypothetical protein
MPKARDGELRVQDLKLAEVLGFGRARDIRKLIERNREELERYGTLPCRAVTPPGGGPVATEYWLNRKQTFLICTKTGVALSRGQIVPPASASSAAAIEAIDELFRVNERL